MATATLPLPVQDTAVGNGRAFTTPERMQEYAQAILNESYGSVVPGLRPQVEVSADPSGGVLVRVSATGEGFGPPIAAARLYPTDRLADKFQVKFAALLQYTNVLGMLGRGLKISADPEGQ